MKLFNNVLVASCNFAATTSALEFSMMVMDAIMNDSLDQLFNPFGGIEVFD